MTPSEAVQKAVANHEFRHYAPATLETRSPAMLKGVEAVVAICWCGMSTPPFITQRAARDAHGRHQARLDM